MPSSDKTVADLDLNDEHITAGLDDSLQEAAKRLLTVPGGILVILDDDSKRRILSIIIALTDDYDGGEFNFPEQSYQVKLKKGEAITFPPNYFYPHEVSPPSNGERYTISLWVLVDPSG